MINSFLSTGWGEKGQSGSRDFFFFKFYFAMTRIIMQCSKLTLVRRPMADNSSSGLTIFEKITLQLALMTDKTLDITMYIEAVRPVG